MRNREDEVEHSAGFPESIAIVVVKRAPIDGRQYVRAWVRVQDTMDWPGVNCKIAPVAFSFLNNSDIFLTLTTTPV